MNFRSTRNGGLGLMRKIFVYIFGSTTSIQSLFKIKKHYINMVLLFYIESRDFFFFDYRKKLLRKQIFVPELWP